MIQNKELNNQLNKILSNTDNEYESLVKEFKENCAKSHIIDIIVATLTQCENGQNIFVTPGNPILVENVADINIYVLAYENNVIISINRKYLPLINDIEDPKEKVDYILKLISESKPEEERFYNKL